MRNSMRLYRFILMLSGCVISACATVSDEAKSRAINAVTNTLFDYDATEFTSYRISDDGIVNITFAKNTPDSKGVLAGRGGPICPAF